MVDAKMTKAEQQAAAAKERRQNFRARAHRVGAQRGGEDSELPELSQFEDLEYCHYEADELAAPARGFMTKEDGRVVMAGLVEFLSKNNIEHNVNDTHFRLNITYKDKPMAFEEAAAEEQ